MQKITDHPRKPTYDLPFPRPLMVVIYALVAYVFFKSPLSHNPDGNFYYGVTLRILNGELWGSVDGLTSPLLSWLMVPAAALGFPIPIAFRLVNSLVLIAIAHVSWRLALGMRITPLCASIAVCCIVVTFSNFTTVLVTSDLLCTLPVLLSLQALFHNQGKRRSYIWCGIWGGIAYYAKALQLPILFVAITLHCVYVMLTGSKTWRSTISLHITSLLACLIVSAPWIIALSLKHEQPIISLQQYTLGGNFNLFDYAPVGEQFAVATQSGDTYDPLRDTFRSLTPNFKRITENARYLCRTSCGLLFGEAACWIIAICFVPLIILTLLNTTHRKICMPLIIFVSAQCGVYLYIWGPYPRYYFAIFPILVILIVHSLEYGFSLLNKKCASNKILTPVRGKVLLAGICSLCLVSILGTTTRSVVTDWYEKRESWSVVKHALQLSELTTHKGRMTGNGDSLYPGLLASWLKREYWNSIFPAHHASSQTIAARLKKWQIEQILWFAAPSPELDQIDFLLRTGPFYAETQQFYLYTVRTP